MTRCTLKILPIKILILIFSTFGYSFDYKVERISVGSNNFPYLISKSDVSVAENINADLYIDILGVPPTRKNPFINTLDEDGRATQIIYDYAVTNDNKVLSVELSMEGCGAYCEAYTIYKNYNILDGKRIDIMDLFTTSGKIKFEKTLQTRIKKNINSFMKSLNVKDETMREQHELYEECLERDYIGKLSNYTSFTINRGKLTITPERCSAHVNRALDDLEGTKYKFSYQELKPYLNIYGILLLDSKRDSYPFDEPRGLYGGKIGGYYAHLYIKNIKDDDSQFVGSYYYDSKQIPIELSGRYSKKSFILHTTNRPTEKEIFRLQYSQNGMGVFSGTWEKNNKKLPARMVGE